MIAIMLPAISLLLLRGLSAFETPLLETHDLKSLLDNSTPIYLLEVIAIDDSNSLPEEPCIPGSKSLPLKKVIDQSAIPRVKAPKEDDFREIAKTYGVPKDETMLVLYERDGMKSAAMLWWTFRCFGRSNMKVLNGGLSKWVREGNPTESPSSESLLDPSSQDAALYQYTYDPSYLWTAADLSSFVSSPSVDIPVQIVDFRARDQFIQANVPGSIHMPADIISLADGTLRTDIELKTIFEGYEVVTSGETLTVAISGDGVDSAYALLALQVLGKPNCANLDGGWEEYIQLPESSSEQNPQAPIEDPQPEESEEEQPTPQEGESEPITEPESQPVEEGEEESGLEPVPEPQVPDVEPPAEPLPPSLLLATSPPSFASPSLLILDSHSPPPCSQTCYAPCLQDPLVSKADCWDACACPSDLLPSFASSAVGLPATSAETTTLLSFLVCTRACGAICDVGDKRCAEKCTFSFCYPGKEDAGAWRYVVAIGGSVAVVWAMGFVLGKGRVKWEIREALLDKLA